MRVTRLSPDNCEELFKAELGWVLKHWLVFIIPINNVSTKCFYSLNIWPPFPGTMWKSVDNWDDPWVSQWLSKITPDRDRPGYKIYVWSIITPTLTNITQSLIFPRLAPLIWSLFLFYAKPLLLTMTNISSAGIAFLARPPQSFLTTTWDSWLMWLLLLSDKSFPSRVGPAQAGVLDTIFI